MQIGDKITFGKHEWRVLDIQDNRALIITEEVIGKRLYHDTPVDGITWAECDMRKYLNGEFYDRFTDEEKARIVTVINENPDNPWFGTKGGEDTEDNVFNLTIFDVTCKYFGDSSNLLYNRGKNQTYWFQRKDPNNYRRIAYFNGEMCKWHLRTPGRYQNRIACIGADANPKKMHLNGSAHITGNGVYQPLKRQNEMNGDSDFMGIRPALWLRLG